MSAKKGVRVKDKWRLKTWYTVYTPPYFGSQEFATVPAADDSRILGRVIETTLYDLTKQDISQSNIKIYFQIISTQGMRADTVFKGHEYAREYLRSIVRRGGSRVDGIYNLETKDGYRLRVQATTFTKKRVNHSRETAIRKITEEILLDKAKNLTLDQLVQEMVLGKVGSDIYNRATKIAPLRHVGVIKSKLLAAPPPLTEKAVPVVA
ncbi:MAG: 30S ribosomal protein S3ae [Candidatus Bathyarchaeia archaeon]